ncbi:hypothetical protein ACFJIX_14720 [Roseateles sp. UC29_93]|uniref:hypothetical protein n=1 Tax=Roseateles sp. UC29_93 TaxID=3350177 RepID=UPI00366DCB96
MTWSSAFWASVSSSAMAGWMCEGSIAAKSGSGAVESRGFAAGDAAAGAAAVESVMQAS